MEPSPVSADMLMETAFRTWPQIISVFLEKKLSCPGCPMNRFETLAEAAEVYHLDIESFLQAIRCSIDAGARISQQETGKES